MGPFPSDSVAQFLESVHCGAQIGGHTHTFYRYPARFSPQFARAAIKLLTRPGDTVLDPFMGGGTTAVEALVSGRRFVGCDVNALARFLVRVKTTPMTDSDLAAVQQWGEQLRSTVNLHRSNTRHEAWDRYQRNVPWWLRKLLEMALDSAGDLTRRQNDFARCTLLRTAQWALDCRREIPTSQHFLRLHLKFLGEMLDAARSYAAKIKAAGWGTTVAQRRRVVGCSAASVDADRRIPRDWLAPRLILTSPPYVGVHVLYHRWQVQGRRETPAPYWLAGCQDGHGSSYYTFADRRNRALQPYLEQLRACFVSVARLMDQRSLVVQLVAFSDPDTQLAPYLESLEAVGLEEAEIPDLYSPQRRIWREVPNRKWYANLRAGTHSSRELLLVHRRSHIR